MCAPIALALIGGVVQGIAGYQQAKTQQANFKAQEQAAERDARIKQVQSSYAGERKFEQGRQLIGRQIAAFGSSGIAANTGSSLDVVASTGADVGLDIAATRWGYERVIENDRFRAQVAGMNARAAGSAAPLAFVAPLLNAGATVLQTPFQGISPYNTGGF